MNAADMLVFNSIGKKHDGSIHQWMLLHLYNANSFNSALFNSGVYYRISAIET